jgi:hypothetical protein
MVIGLYARLPVLQVGSIVQAVTVIVPMYVPGPNDAGEGTVTVIIPAIAGEYWI